MALSSTLEAGAVPGNVFLSPSPHLGWKDSAAGAIDRSARTW